MARRPRDTQLGTREARKRLARQKEPHWRQIVPGLFLGYYKGERGGIWFMSQLTGGRYKKTRLGIADDLIDANGQTVLSYADAHRLALERAEAATLTPSGRELTVGEAVDDYLRWYQAHRKDYSGAKRTIEAHIRPRFGAIRVADLTTHQIRKWHEDLFRARIRKGKKRIEVNLSDPETARKRKASANRVLTILKAALNHAWHQHSDILSREAWSRVKPFPNADSPRVRYLSEKQCRTLLKACEPDFEPLVRAALLTGCRYGELTRLEARDYNPDSRTLLVSLAKGGRARHVPLTDEAAAFFAGLVRDAEPGALIFRRKDGEPWGPSHQVRRITSASRAAGIDPPISFHDLRHTYGSLLALHGAPLQVIASVLGHADTRITQRHYAHLQPDFVAETVRRSLPALGG